MHNAEIPNRTLDNLLANRRPTNRRRHDYPNRNRSPDTKVLAKLMEHFIRVTTNYGDEVSIPLETVLGWLKDERERVLAHFQLNYRCMSDIGNKVHECDGWRYECDESEEDELGYETRPTYWELEKAIMNPEV